MVTPPPVRPDSTEWDPVTSWWRTWHLAGVIFLVGLWLLFAAAVAYGWGDSSATRCVTP